MCVVCVAARRCVVELYVFYEMSADSEQRSRARIEVVDLPGTPAYTAEGCRLSEPGPVDAPATPPSARPHARSRHLFIERFDVRKAQCNFESDRERLLSVIEGVGAGFERFNAWVHRLLLESQTPPGLA